MPKTEVKPGPGCLGFMALLMIPLLLWRGYVLTVLWQWFVVPQWGVAPLPVSIATGLCTLLCLARPNNPLPPSDKPELEQHITIVVNAVVHPLLALAFGFVLHLLRGWL